MERGLKERLNLIYSDRFGGNLSELANTIGCPRSTASNIFVRGSNLPSFELVRKICSVLGISADWLLFGIGSMSGESDDKSVCILDDAMMIDGRRKSDERIYLRELDSLSITAIVRHGSELLCLSRIDEVDRSSLIREKMCLYVVQNGSVEVTEDYADSDKFSDEAELYRIKCRITFNV
ncbi:MAG: helix-turn-helix transcriptional regulator [Paludibacteraceae bacterium]|nr:helix-turn-helix transcriptional regulator [Paludibacteraceae bacterium]